MKVDIALASTNLEFLRRRYQNLIKEKDKVMGEYDEKIQALFTELQAEEAKLQAESEDGYKFWIEVDGKKLASVKSMEAARTYYPNPLATPEGAKIFAQYQLHKPILVMERVTKNDFDHQRPGTVRWRWSSKEALMRFGTEDAIYLRLGADAAKNRFPQKE